jgi:hypothetical protein
VFLESQGFKATNWMGRWGPFFYAEGVLEEGESVSVGGGSAHEVDPLGERTGPRSPPERLVLRGSQAQPLLISDARAAGA